LPINTLTAGFTPKVEYQGTVNATASISASGGAPFGGSARADLVDASIRHKLASGRTDVISFGSGFVTLQAEPDHVTGELRLDAAARGLISGRMRAERSAADTMDWPLRGQLQMATGELGFITLYAPDVDRASGHFDANLSFEGTLGKPSASALESTGKLRWRDGQPYGDITLTGENLRLVDVPEARIDASPDLNFRIDAHDIFVKGEVKVPLARIRPADLTNAVLPSADEVLVGPTEKIETDPFRVTSEITMTLGDKVSI